MLKRQKSTSCCLLFLSCLLLPLVAGSAELESYSDIQRLDFSLPDFRDKPHALADYQGKVLLVNFWASWCPPCRDEFPALVRAYDAHVGDGLEILGVTFNDRPDNARAFVEGSGATWPILPDPERAAWDAFSPVGPPTSYFVDADGVVQRVHIGAVDDEQLADHLTAIGL